MQQKSIEYSYFDTIINNNMKKYILQNACKMKTTNLA